MYLVKTRKDCLDRGRFPKYTSPIARDRECSLISICSRSSTSGNLHDGYYFWRDSWLIRLERR